MRWTPFSLANFAFSSSLFNCLSNSPLSTMVDTVEFECEKGHHFHMKCAVFKNIANKVKYRDEACPHCHKENSTQKVRET